MRSTMTAIATDIVAMPPWIPAFSATAPTIVGIMMAPMVAVPMQSPVATVELLYFFSIVESVVGYMPLIERPTRNTAAAMTAGFDETIITMKKNVIISPSTSIRRFLFILADMTAQMRRPARIMIQRHDCIAVESQSGKIPASWK